MAVSKNQLKGRYEQYKRSSAYSLYDCYEKFSSKKASAWKYCEELMEKHNGSNLKVISYNTNIFTAGFEFEENGVQKFMYITPTADTIWEVE